MPHSERRHRSGIHYVYRIQSVNHPDQSLVDTSSDVTRRISLHNAGKVEATREFAPWRLSFYAAFPDRQHAKDFCEYLRSGAGKAFGHKHLWGEVSREPFG